MNRFRSRLFVRGLFAFLATTAFVIGCRQQQAAPPDDKDEASPAEARAGEDPNEAGDRLVDRLRGSPGWRTMPAVERGWIHVLDEDTCMRPGPRLAGALGRFAEFIQAPAEDVAE